jgi:asparagine synthase (glutamine-hydrolysing)
LSRQLSRIAPGDYDAALRYLVPERARPRLLGNKLQKLVTAMGAPSPQDFYRALCSQWQEPQSILLHQAVEATQLPELPGGSMASSMMLLDLVTYLPDDVLTKVDRATMSVALEARAPFLDHRVVELGWKLPTQFKIRKGVGKWPLRQLLYRYVPRELVDRPKMGFAVPVGSWLRGPLRDWAEALLDQDARSANPWFHEDALRGAWQAHLAGRQDHSGGLWAVLMFQSWLNGPSGPAAAALRGI